MELAAAKADRVIATQRGRGRQMNAGAAIATGDVLWFLHADSKISSPAVEAMTFFMSNPRNEGGCFSLSIFPSRWVYKIRDFIGNYCVDLSGIALGDRGLFCRRSTFSATGGFPEDPFFEDADFYRALAQIGATRRLNVAIQTSSRRYEAQGPVRTCVFYGFVMLLYWLAFPKTTLERFVRRFSSRCQRQKKNASAMSPMADVVGTRSSSVQLKPNTGKPLYEKSNS